MIIILFMVSVQAASNIKPFTGVLIVTRREKRTYFVMRKLVTSAAGLIS